MPYHPNTVKVARDMIIQLNGTDKCETCSKKGKIIHHRDGNPQNNLISNLSLVCHSCHRKQHRPSGIIFNSSIKPTIRLKHDILKNKNRDSAI